VYPSDPPGPPGYVTGEIYRYDTLSGCCRKTSLHDNCGLKTLTMALFACD
jgi:hypothetical protein